MTAVTDTPPTSAEGAGPSGAAGPLLVADPVDPQQIPDVTHLRALPEIGLEPADLPATPAEQVAHVVGGVPGGVPQLGQTTG